MGGGWGWLAGLTETKANSGFKLSMNLGLACAELGNMPYGIDDITQNMCLQKP